MDLLVSLLPVLLIGGLFFLWIAMFIHAAKSDIPNKLLWILILIVTNLVGGLIYYFAVYQKLKKKNDNELIKRTLIIGGMVLAIIVIIVAFTQPASRVNNVEDIPLDKVVNYSIREEIKRIEMRGDELLITKKGEAAPSLRSKKPPGSNIREHGINLEKVEIRIVR